MHKGENLGRIISNAEDRWKIKIIVRKCIHLLQVDSHTSNVLAKIYTSGESNQSVNMNKAEDIGVKQMIEFQDDHSGTFREP